MSNFEVFMRTVSIFMDLIFLLLLMAYAWIDSRTKNEYESLKTFLKDHEKSMNKHSEDMASHEKKMEQIVGKTSEPRKIGIQ